MSTTRNTAASAHARIDVLDAKLDLILARLEGNAPAKADAPKRTRKAPARKAQPKAAPKPATKGAQTRATLTRSEWNHTLTAKARFAGGDAYKRVLAAWAQVQEMRSTMTPDEALAAVLGA